VLISAFVSLTLTPMLDAYLMKKGGHKKTRFYNFTEPYFQKMNTGYAEALAGFMKRRWLSLPIIFGCLAMIVLFYVNLQKETAPYDDRSMLRLQVSAPEGASYEYMDRFMKELTQLLNDSVPEKQV